MNKHTAVWRVYVDYGGGWTHVYTTWEEDEVRRWVGWRDYWRLYRLPVKIIKQQWRGGR